MRVEHGDDLMSAGDPGWARMIRKESEMAYLRQAGDEMGVEIVKLAAEGMEYVPGRNVRCTVSEGSVYVEIRTTGAYEEKYSKDGLTPFWKRVQVIADEDLLNNPR
jgi:hypothetical protein